MQYARIQVLPDIPPGGVCAGIDWASKDYVACVVDMAGRVTDRFSAAHDKAGIAGMIARLRRSGAAEVAIERSDGVLVGALLAAGLTVVVITSRQVRNLRSRYGAAGGKDDRFDSYVLADTLRTDRARLRPLAADTPATIALRSAVRARKDLVAHRVAAANQLRAHLAVAFPAAVGLFSELDGPLSLAFLARFGSQDTAAQLDENAIAGWLNSLPARGNPAPPGVLCARLQSAPAGATGGHGAAQAGVTAALAAALAGLAAQIKALETQIAGQLAAHPDARIFTSLPRAGTLRAARLLAEIGDCRSRFPDSWSLAALAGTAPVTRRSGTHISHTFRWAVSHQLRDAVLRLRRRLPARQPLGRGHLPRRPRPRQRPPACRPHHRPRLDLRDLALLARRHRLRPRQAQRLPGHPGPEGGRRRRWARPVTAAITAALRARAAGLYPDEAGTELAHRPRRAPRPRRLQHLHARRHQHHRRHHPDGLDRLARRDRRTATPVRRRTSHPAARRQHRRRNPGQPPRHHPRPGRPQPPTPDHSHPARGRAPARPPLTPHHQPGSRQHPRDPG